MSNRYRILLTGEMSPGFDQQRAAAVLTKRLGLDDDQLTCLFRGEPQTLERTLSADEALALHEPLEQVGVQFKYTPLATVNNNAPVVDPRKRAAGMMHCPACGHAQVVARSCEACGIEFDAYHRDGKPAPRRPVKSAAHAGVGPNWSRWDELRDDEPTEEDDLALYMGHGREHYLNFHKRTRFGARNHFRLGWNWGAVISPFLWAMHRKMWFWSLLLGFVDVILPILAFTLGQRGVPSGDMVYVGYFLLLANRMFWPLVADHIYVRHVRGAVAGLHAAAPTRAAEIDIATAGGTSKTAVFFGLCTALTGAVFVWSLAGSVLPQQPPFASGPVVDDPGTLDAAGRRTAFQGPGSIREGVQSTHANFNQLAEVVSKWREQHPEPGALARLTMTRMRKEMGLQKKLVEDAWGSEIQILPAGDGFRLISAGPDRLYATGDDLVLERNLKK